MRTKSFAGGLLGGLGLLLCAAQTAFAWAQIYQKTTWPAGPVTMQLQLGSMPIPGVLQDGSASWQDSAITALKRWNAEMKVSSFAWVKDSTAPVNSSRSYGNGYNNVLWSDTVYGDNWDADGEGVLGITLIYSNLYETFEADVLINSGIKGSWNSYQGALRSGGNGQPVWDFQRVMLHELGHVLGLDHPDRYEPAPPALMNKAISNLYDLVADDQAGARALYGQLRAPKILDGGLRTVSTFTGSTLDLYLASVTGTPPFSFSWTKDGKDLGVGGNVFVIPSMVLSDSGEYAVTVTNSAGSISSVLKVDVLESPIPPSVTRQASAGKVTVGSAVSLSIEASGSQPLHYHWLRKPKGRRQWQALRDSAAWDGTQGQALRLIRVTPEMNGDQFMCEVVNGAPPSTVSEPVTLEVILP